MNSTFYDIDLHFHTGGSVYLGSVWASSHDDAKLKACMKYDKALEDHAREHGDFEIAISCDESTGNYQCTEG